jgi:hypothetical protein
MQLKPLFTLVAALRPQEIGHTPEGDRVDVEFEGELCPGGRVSGRLKGIDYITINANGVGLLHIHGTVTNDATGLVAFLGTGLATLAADGTFTTREFFTFQTASAEVAWLNRIAGIGVGSGDLNKKEFRLAVYTLEE